MDEPFKFDPNSTKNEGRWRLIDPKNFIKSKKGWFRKKHPDYEGISHVFGPIKGESQPKIQTIRFNKGLWTEKKAAKWWKENKHNYHREWTEKDWDAWKIEKEEAETEAVAAKARPPKGRITRRRALLLSKKIVESLGAKYVPQKEITIDHKFKKDIGFPAGSVRYGKKEVGDLDIVITKQVSVEEVKELKNVTKIISGGTKNIKFEYHYTCPEDKNGCIIGVDLFIFLDKNTWGAALLHVSGPWQYNAIIRKKVNSFGEGWSLSQNGLVNGFDEIIPTPTERSLQKEIDVHQRTPEERAEFKKTFGVKK